MAERAEKADISVLIDADVSVRTRTHAGESSPSWSADEKAAIVTFAYRARADRNISLRASNSSTSTP